MSKSGLARKQTIPKDLSGIVCDRSPVVPEAEESTGPTWVSGMSPLVQMTQGDARRRRGLCSHTEG